MGISASLKAYNAAKKQSKGEIAEAQKLYEEAMAAGLSDARYMLSYSVLLIRKGDYQKARSVLVKAQKAPNITDAQKRQLYVNYAACVYKMGEIEKGIELLERTHNKAESGLVYQTLGYLYIEAGDKDKALDFCKAAIEYDDEDPIALDNMAQVYYRLLGDKETAKGYFDRAHAIKPTQIDTLYFLAQYDIEAGNKEEAKEKLETALEGRFSPLNFVTKEKVEEELKKLG